MRAPALAAIGVVAYVSFLVATMPARFVAERVASRQPNAVRVHDASGTVWHGAARMDVAAGPLWIPVESAAWRLLPAQLLSGRIAFAVDAQSGAASAKGIVARGVSGWHAQGEASAPAAFAATVMPLAATWHPEGRIDMRSEGIAWNDRGLAGDVLAEWREAAVALSEVRPLGNYRATLHAEGETAKVAVRTLDGPLRVAGQGQLARDGRFTFEGEARAEGADARALEPLLDLLGARRPDGARSLSWRAN